ncbi:MAG: hypothetical protein IT534_04760 [Bauldia sp.]|nr:hypothetical protein [Bauldia sp.]
MSRSRIPALLAGAACAAIVSLSARAADMAQPFTEWTVELGQAAGFESIAETLMLAAVLDEPPANAEEIADAMTGAAFDRFAGTLAARDPALAENLRSALADIGEAFGEGEVSEDDVTAAMVLWRAAYDTVIDPTLQALPAFRAAVMTNLLVRPGGVSEGYEGPEAYPMGWAALARVRILWGELSAGLSTEQKAQVEENLSELGGLYPAVDAMPRMVGIGTEDAEPGAQALVGGLETVANADLYGARDLAALAIHLGDVIAAACPAFDDEDTAARALEAIYAAHDRYGDLAGLLDVFDPDAKESIEAGFDALGIVAYDDDGGSASGSAAPAASSSDSGADQPVACAQLADDLHAAAAILN